MKNIKIPEVVYMIPSQYDISGEIKEYRLLSFCKSKNLPINLIIIIVVNIESNWEIEFVFDTKLQKVIGYHNSSFRCYLKESEIIRYKEEEYFINKDAAILAHLKSLKKELKKKYQHFLSITEKIEEKVKSYNK